MSKSIAFVASIYNEVDKIQRQLDEMRISYIHIFPYGSEPDGYDIIEYNVRPDKKHGEILDLAQCVSSHGFPDDIYVPPVRALFSGDNNQALDNATKHLVLDRLEATLTDDLQEVTREFYHARIEEIKNTKKKLTEMTTRELSTAIEFEEDPMIIIAMFTVLFDKIHCEDMPDNWGNPTRGYTAKNNKVVKGFMNPRSIGWIAELWNNLLPEQSEYNQRKYLKSLRTRGKNILKEKGNIYGLRFFIEYLIESDAESIQPKPLETDGTTITYEGFDLAEDDIPFSLLLLIPILSLLEPVYQLI